MGEINGLMTTVILMFSASAMAHPLFALASQACFTENEETPCVGQTRRVDDFDEHTRKGTPDCGRVERSTASGEDYRAHIRQLTDVVLHLLDDGGDERLGLFEVGGEVNVRSIEKERGALAQRLVDPLKILDGFAMRW